MSLLIFAATGIIGIICVLAVIYIYGYIRAMMPPRNAPSRCIRPERLQDKKVVVCAGDSITHGRVSANYVDVLERRLGPERFAVVNAGKNSELSWNLLQRAEDIIKCHPDYVSILIGTNDANCMLSEKVCKRQMRAMKLPQRPDEQWFKKNLVLLCKILKEKTSAKIGLLSIPPIGEDLESAPVKLTLRFSQIIHEVAWENDCVYIPLYEKMLDYITMKASPCKIHYADGSETAMYVALVKRFLLGKSFDAISRENGFAMLTDLLHLNDTAASMVAELIEKYLLRENNENE